MGAPRKRKKIPTTVLMIGEGAVTEKKWLEHLQDLFEQSEIATTVKAGRGNAKGTLRVALNEVEDDHGFDRVLVLMDTDESWGDPNKPADVDTITRAVECKIKLLGTDPCLEGFLLRLLKHPEAPAHAVGKRFKKQQHTNMLRQIHARFQGRIPVGGTRPQGSLCDASKSTLAGHLGGKLHEKPILEDKFDENVIKAQENHHAILEVILRYFRNADVKYDPTILIG